MDGWFLNGTRIKFNTYNICVFVYVRAYKGLLAFYFILIMLDKLLTTVQIEKDEITEIDLKKDTDPSVCDNKGEGSDSNNYSNQDPNL